MSLHLGRYAASTSTAAALDRLLRERADPMAAAQQVETGHRCPRCGSAHHGQPWAKVDGRRVAVSVSRSGPHLLVAVDTDARALGVDVESVLAVQHHWHEDVLAPGEVARTPEERARAWVAKEAVLKARGTGLRVAMCTVVVAEHEVRAVPAPEGFVAALVVGRPTDDSLVSVRSTQS